MIFSTQKPNTENNDDVSEMISTNEIKLPVKHTESIDINENYVKEISNLLTSTESSSQIDQTITNQVVETTTDTNTGHSLPNIISVVCIWC